MPLLGTFGSNSVKGIRQISGPGLGSIVTTNLVLQLDPANVSGSSWLDSSGTNNNFSLDNSSARRPENPPYMDFNGSYGMAYNGGDLPYTGNITYVVVTRPRSSVGDWRTLTRGFGGDHHVIIESGSYRLGMYDNDGGNFIDSGFSQTSLPNWGTNDWVVMYFRWQSGRGYRFSYNNTPETIRGEITSSSGQYNRSFGTIGGNGRSNQYWGDIGYFLMYNRYLTDAECLQNYNALSNVFTIQSQSQSVGTPGVNFASTENGATIGNATVNGSNVSSDYFGPSAYSLSMSTSGSWPAVGAIFNNGSNVNSISRSSKSSSNGSTFSGGGSAGSPFHIVIDLGQSRTFNQARYYQMFSDGKATHVALDVSSSNNLETFSSGNWTQIHDYNILDNDSNSNGIAVNFSNITARYLRVRVYNDGRYGDGSYTELYNIKLFYN